MENSFDKTKYRLDTVGLIFPTRGRPKILERTLCSLAETVGADKLEIVIVTDDDLESSVVVDSFPLRNNFSSLKVYNSEERLYSVKGFIKALELSNSYVFCWMNDENIYEPDWYMKAISRFWGTFPDGIGVLSLYKMKKAGLGMSSRSFVHYNEDEFFHSGYTLYYPDDELTCRAILLGRYAFFPDTGVFHDTEVTMKIPIIPWEERDKMKRKDRGIFYTRNDQGFFLDPEKVYPWPGRFVPVNKPLKKRG